MSGFKYMTRVFFFNFFEKFNGQSIVKFIQEEVKRFTTLDNSEELKFFLDKESVV